MPATETPAFFPKQGKTRRAVDKSGRKAVAHVVTAFRQPSPSYRDVFGQDKPDARTTGEDLMILRAYMHLKGFPEIPEQRSVSTFATLLSRFILPRRDWRVFSSGIADTEAARAFCRQQATQLLPEVVKAKGAKAQPIMRRGMIPEMVAFYNPHYLGLGVN